MIFKRRREHLASFFIQVAYPGQIFAFIDSKYTATAILSGLVLPAKG